MLNVKIGFFAYKMGLAKGPTTNLVAIGNIGGDSDDERWFPLYFLDLEVHLIVGILALLNLLPNDINLALRDGLVPLNGIDSF